MANSSQHKLKLLLALFLTAIVLWVPLTLHAQEGDVLQRRYSFDTRRLSLFDALNTISQQTGYYFIYDSKVLESDKRVRLEAKSETLENILNRLINNPTLTYTVISHHILISYKGKKPAADVKPTIPKDTASIFRGNVYDINTRQPMPYVSIALEGSSAGTITNGDGHFALRVPTEKNAGNLVVSHIGYKPYKAPLRLANNQALTIYLQPEVIPIQEVVIRRIDAQGFVEKAIEGRGQNYSTSPVYLTTFYREGVQKDRRYLNYSEAVFRVYQPAFNQPFANDQVKEIKARKISNKDQSDTLVLKLKGGVAACLELNLVRSLPDFLDPQEMGKYRYLLSDIVTYNSKNAYAISFEQRPEVDDPLFTGTLYIDSDSLAILGADFEINPKYVGKAGAYLITKNSKTHIIKPEQFAYSVTYRKVGGCYIMNHCKCIIKLKARKKGRLLNSNFEAFLEMATLDVSRNNVTKFERDEILRPQSIFADAAYSYDPDFWGDFNIIVPEEKLGEALTRINARIEESK